MEFLGDSREEPRLSGISPAFAGLSLSPGQVPTCYAAVCHALAGIRLACVRRTASVHSEPGSNSSKRRLIPRSAEAGGVELKIH